MEKGLLLLSFLSTIHYFSHPQQKNEMNKIYNPLSTFSTRDLMSRHIRIYDLNEPVPRTERKRTRPKVKPLTKTVVSAKRAAAAPAKPSRKRGRPEDFLEAIYLDNEEVAAMEEKRFYEAIALDECTDMYASDQDYEYMY